MWRAISVVDHSLQYVMPGMSLPMVKAGRRHSRECDGRPCVVGGHRLAVPIARLRPGEKAKGGSAGLFDDIFPVLVDIHTLGQRVAIGHAAAHHLSVEVVHLVVDTSL